MCKNTFCFLHNIGILKLNAIKASWLNNGLRLRERKHITAHNATKLSDIKLVVCYILNYAEDHAILLPGRVPGFKRDDIQWVAYHEVTTQCEPRGDDTVKVSQLFVTHSSVGSGDS